MDQVSECEPTSERLRTQATRLISSHPIRGNHPTTSQMGKLAVGERPFVGRSRRWRPQPSCFAIPDGGPHRSTTGSREPNISDRVGSCRVAPDIRLGSHHAHKHSEGRQGRVVDRANTGSAPGLSHQSAEKAKQSVCSARSSRSLRPNVVRQRRSDRAPPDGDTASRHSRRARLQSPASDDRGHALPAPPPASQRSATSVAHPPSRGCVPQPNPPACAHG